MFFLSLILSLTRSYPLTQQIYEVMKWGFSGRLSDVSTFDLAATNVRQLTNVRPTSVCYPGFNLLQVKNLSLYPTVSCELADPPGYG